jgi:hypothetical protein
MSTDCRDSTFAPNTARTGIPILAWKLKQHLDQQMLFGGSVRIPPVLPPFRTRASRNHIISDFVGLSAGGDDDRCIVST